MITLLKSGERGRGDYGWLKTRYSFSFADYYNPQRMGVSALRVINDDWIAPAAGFDTHPHRDMEIITYMLEGAIEHRDTMGFHTTLRAGEVQVMSAGSGIRHSEHNPSPDAPLKLLQIWIQPRERGVSPRYAQKDFGDSRGVTLLVSGDGRGESLPIHQDARLYQLRLPAGKQKLELETGRTGYLHLISGTLSLDNRSLAAGDAAVVEGQAQAELRVEAPIEALWFDLP
ncbi:pirin family protein [Aestuariirhabdus litorea]|uniref:Pirin family protein n=1 Tax=Aestuariirhabdus litorea TaxID=2528527 RepID=A0A3P3VQY2_9GAMM|nr:pirin family protein [Aestuariirhabdus litorea]RRJ84076.1 pirin family protein [Aestuariirhabdus litorea]RWW97296.1 pirin family protein [Endozoicomonadaceae bacterium GTF-13]